jgi:hypothetical protein
MVFKNVPRLPLPPPPPGGGLWIPTPPDPGQRSLIDRVKEVLGLGPQPFRGWGPEIDGRVSDYRHSSVSGCVYADGPASGGGPVFRQPKITADPGYCSVYPPDQPDIITYSVTYAFHDGKGIVYRSRDDEYYTPEPKPERAIRHPPSPRRNAYQDAEDFMKLDPALEFPESEDQTKVFEELMGAYQKLEAERQKGHERPRRFPFR